MIKSTAKTINELLKDLKTSVTGLSFGEAQRRLNKYGPNSLPQKKALSGFAIIFNQFKSPLVYVLFIAAIVSLVIGDINDAEIIIFVVLVNAAVGYWQEAKAQKTLYKLKQILPAKALVRRKGEIKKILAKELVPGDIIILQAGENVVADACLIQAIDLQVDESFLTGESRLVTKKLDLSVRNNFFNNKQMVFAGSVVQYGQGEAVVVATGLKTKLGGIANLIQNVKETNTPLQQRIKSLANRLVFIILAISAGIFLIGLYRGYALPEIFRVAVAVAVASIPEGLLIAITVILAIGMQRILDRKALVRQLLSAETLGSVSVICTDKTGTLTEGAMKVTKLLSFDNKKPMELSGHDQSVVKKFLEIALYCNDAVVENYAGAKERWKLNGRPTDRSLLQLVLDNGIEIEEARKSSERLTYIPFDSQRKFMATLNKDEKAGGGFMIYTKGAPEIILKRSRKIMLKGGKESELSTKILNDTIKTVENLSGRGYRLLAAAYKRVKDEGHQVDRTLQVEDVQDLVLVGFYIISDPVRPEVKETIKMAKNAGIKTVMITGDHVKTAQAIASELNLPTDSVAVITGEQLKNMSDKEFEARVQDIVVYARMNPEDKLRIVDAWQKLGYVVAMTGDGINDAPALKKADVGIAVGSGTDVAKETADLVLLDNNFTTIIDAVREGRVIFSNVKKVTYILLSGAFAGVIIIAVALVFDWPLPLLAVQILWVNIITDGLPDIALTAEPGEDNILKYPPVNRNELILDMKAKILIGLIALILAVAVLFGYLWTLPEEGLFKARTISFTIFALASLVMIYGIRDLKKYIWQKNILDNKFLLSAVIFGFGLQLFALYAPFMQNILGTVALDFADWFRVALIGGLVIFTIEVLKWALSKFNFGQYSKN